jgi:hypothetical protein
MDGMEAEAKDGLAIGKGQVGAEEMGQVRLDLVYKNFDNLFEQKFRQNWLHFIDDSQRAL